MLEWLLYFRDVVQEASAEVEIRYGQGKRCCWTEARYTSEIAPQVLRAPLTLFFHRITAETFMRLAKNFDHGLFGDSLTRHNGVTQVSLISQEPI